MQTYAVKRCKRIQKKAFMEYNSKLSSRLGSMDKSDKIFWNLTKEIAGLQTNLSKSTPSPDELASHFAKKMSNAADIYDNDWELPRRNVKTSKKTGFSGKHEASVEVSAILRLQQVHQRGTECFIEGVC